MHERQLLFWGDIDHDIRLLLKNSRQDVCRGGLFDRGTRCDNLLLPGLSSRIKHSASKVSSLSPVKDLTTKVRCSLEDHLHITSGDSGWSKVKDGTANLMQEKDQNHIWNGKSRRRAFAFEVTSLCLWGPQALSWLRAALSFHVLSVSCHKELALRHNK